MTNLALFTRVTEIPLAGVALGWRHGGYLWFRGIGCGRSLGLPLPDGLYGVEQYASVQILAAKIVSC